MMNGRYDFWLLDLDGTLVDVESSYVHEVFDEVGDHIGRSFTEREAEILWHGLCGPRDEQLAAWGIDVPEFWRTFHDVEDPVARADASFLYDDAAFVGDLDRPVGLVTHCQRYLTEPVLEQVGIDDWFDTVICCSDDLGWKPDPAPVELAMSRLDVAHNGHRGVLAGDGPNDVGAAWNAGLDGIHVERHDPDRRGLCVLGDYRVTNFDELAALVDHSD